MHALDELPTTTFRDPAVDAGSGRDGNGTRPVRLLIAEDFPVVREALSGALSKDSRFEVVASCVDGISAISAAAVARPDVALLDLSLPDIGGLEVLERLRAENAAIRVLVFTASERPSQVVAAMAAGAHGYLVKRQPVEELAAAIIAVHAGGVVVCPRLARYLIAEAPHAPGAEVDGAPLTQAEIEVLRRVAGGATDLQIARELYVSTRTVQNLLAKVRRKSGVHRRAELTQWAIRNAWL